MKKRYLVVSLLLGLFICSSSSSWAYVIGHGRTGGDCSIIGTWDANTATCTLNTDITLSENNYTRLNGWIVQLAISGSGITIDGNGHKITGDWGAQSLGISIDGGRNINITSITIEGYNRAVLLSTVGSLTTLSDNATNSNINITNNIIRYNREGIAGAIEESNISNNIIDSNRPGWGLILSSYKCVISGNTISNNGYGIAMSGRFGQPYMLNGIEAENTVINNIISSNWNAGMEIVGANNTISGNTFSHNNNFQLVSNSPDMNKPNKVYRNNFIAYKNIIKVAGYNIFNLDLPFGGNYWSDFDTPEKGCSDSNEDGICDMSKIIINSFFDNLPWTKQNGWPVSSGGSTGGGSKGGGRK